MFANRELSWNSAALLLEYAGEGGSSLCFLDQAGQRKWLSQRIALGTAVSLQSLDCSPFPELTQANAWRSRSERTAKANLTLAFDQHCFVPEGRVVLH
jgi:hypothetical protein